MGRIVIRQPNRLFSVWSTVMDDFVVTNATPEQIANHYAEEARAITHADWLRACQRADLHQTGWALLTWRDAVNERSAVHVWPRVRPRGVRWRRYGGGYATSKAGPPLDTPTSPRIA